MNKLEIITYLALWGTIILQSLTIRDLRKRVENEQKWSEYWRKSWLKEGEQTMSRYIDADALKEWLDEYLSVFKKYDKSEVKGFVEHQPSIDIVRCKECKYYKQSEAFCENGNGLWQAGDECFCSYGEREGE